MTAGLSRTTVLTVVTAIEIAVLLFFVGRWYSRKYGWRKVFRRSWHYLRDTVTDLARPGMQLYRFGRSVRTIVSQLVNPCLHEELGTLTGAVRARLGEVPDGRPYAVRLAGSRAEVAVAGAGPARLAGLRRTPDGWWATTREDLITRPDDAPEGADRDLTTGHVAIGCDRGRVTYLDLLEAPGAVEVTGPDRAVRSLVWAVAGQLVQRAHRSHDLDVIVAGGLRPGFAGPSVTSALRTISESPYQEHRFVVLVCGPLSPPEADLLTRELPGLPDLRVVVAGPYAGRRWSLPVSATGRIDAPTLRIHTDSAPVERAVTLAVRRRQRTNEAVAPVRVPAAPPRSSTPRSTPAPPPEPTPTPAADVPETGPTDWKFDEPEPDSPGTGVLSLSAVRAHQAASPPDDDPADGPRPDQAASRR